MDSKVTRVSADRLAHNPHRNLAAYPFVERKIEALMRSFTDVGMWEGVIARPAGDTYEIAFGHHRVEAARRLGVDVPLIVRDLTDEQMIQFMGRENLEDYNADFLCMLESWRAAQVFLSGHGRKNAQPVEIANLLGWASRDDRNNSWRLNNTAEACASASKLIDGGWVSNEELRGLAVKSVREICARAVSRMEQIEKVAKQQQLPARDVDVAKRQVSKAIKKTSEDVREGRIPARDVRSEVDVNTYRFSKQVKRPSPLFATFGAALADSIDKMLVSDSASSRLQAIAESVGIIEREEDLETIRRVDFALSELERRPGMWRKKITPTKEKVVQLKALPGGEK